MKRIISAVMVMMLLLSMAQLTRETFATSNSVTITYYENYSTDGTSLTASRSEFVEVKKLYASTMTTNALHISGYGSEGKAFDINVPIQNGVFVDPTENKGNYYVLSVIDLGDVIRTILKDNGANNMLFVDMRINDGIDKRVKIGNYNTNWYRAFLGGDIILEEEIISEPMRNSTYYLLRTYSTTNNIYGHIWKEYIRIMAIQDYPQIINNSTGGTFSFTLGIKEKWTAYTPYGGDTVITNGCSLGMNSAEINLSTPKGEYFSSMTTDFVGQIYNHPNPLSFGFNLNIPCTPFSITYSYSHHDPGYGASYYHYYPGITNKATQVGNIWSGAGYWTYNAAGTNEDVGDRFVASMKVDTYTPYQVFGSKSLNFKWDYFITGTGVNEEYGIAVTMPTIQDSITNIVSYSLVSAK